ncbi:MAG: hypothetical protein JSS27_19570 [Planctomycetes bacterium]|nr:hypothetical protein [Planctomycetota bacterium]
MTQTVLHRAFAPLRRLLPRSVSNLLRSTVTALLTPLRFAWRSGHFRSSFKMAAVARDGKPIPWYTYPAIDLLSQRTYAGKHVLEFGAGQSTFWWSERAARILALEESPAWYKKLLPAMPANVDLRLITLASPERCVAEVEQTLAGYPIQQFDVIVIDGLFRMELVEVAKRYVAPRGIIICDDSEGFHFWEMFRDSGFQHVEFYGYAPGVMLERCTSIFFRDGAFIFDGEWPIPVLAEQ